MIGTVLRKRMPIIRQLVAGGPVAKANRVMVVAERRQRVDEVSLRIEDEHVTVGKPQRIAVEPRLKRHRIAYLIQSSNRHIQSAVEPDCRGVSALLDLSVLLTHLHRPPDYDEGVRG